MSTVTSAEMAMLQNIRAKADELARPWQEAIAQGFAINFNLNPHIGACDNFAAHKMVPIDLRASAN